MPGLPSPMDASKLLKIAHSYGAYRQATTNTIIITTAVSPVFAHETRLEEAANAFIE